MTRRDVLVHRGVLTGWAGLTTTSNVSYAYAGFTDTPAAVLDATGNVLQGFVGLPGGVTVTTQTSGNTWSYPDLHGNHTVLTDNSGNRTAGPVTYDPWGQLTAGNTPLHNTQGASTLGAFGTSGKLTDTTTTTNILGARPYNAAEGRFLTVDPVAGGCANAYVYAFGDPLNSAELTGRALCTNITAETAVNLGIDIEEGQSIANLMTKFPGSLRPMTGPNADTDDPLLRSHAAYQIAEHYLNPVTKVLEAE